MGSISISGVQGDKLLSRRPLLSFSHQDIGGTALLNPASRCSVALLCSPLRNGLFIGEALAGGAAGFRGPKSLSIKLLTLSRRCLTLVWVWRRESDLRTPSAWLVGAMMAEAGAEARCRELGSGGNRRSGGLDRLWKWIWEVVLCFSERAAPWQLCEHGRGGAWHGAQSPREPRGLHTKAWRWGCACETHEVEGVISNLKRG